MPCFVQNGGELEVRQYVTLLGPKEGLKITLSLPVGPKTTRVTIDGKSILAVILHLIDLEFGPSGCRDLSFTHQHSHYGYKTTRVT